jgi:hypothetical protein
MHPFSILQHQRNRRRSDSRSLISLADEVERRIDSGRVADAEPYNRLVNWVRMPREAAMVTGQDIDWSFYGSTFDTVLFELWCMQTLSERLTAAFGTPSEIPDLRRNSANRAYIWRINSFEIGLHFQKSLRSSSPGRSVVWKHADGKAFGGRPDLTISISRTGTRNGTRFIYLDPKLRQKTGFPTEEMYKLLGYFSNSGYGSSGKGAILTYAPVPHMPSVRTLRSDDEGLALAAALDPERPEFNSPVFEALVRLVLDELDSSGPSAESSLF